jgi:hypothetical protein
LPTRFKHLILHPGNLPGLKLPPNLHMAKGLFLLLHLKLMSQEQDYITNLRFFANFNCYSAYFSAIDDGMNPLVTFLHRISDRLPPGRVSRSDEIFQYRILGKCTFRRCPYCVFYQSS